VTSFEPFDPSRASSPPPAPTAPAAFPPPAFPLRPVSSPAADPWGHEVGEEDAHALLDARGHARHEQEQLARMLGEPVPIDVARERRRQLVIRIVVVVVALAVIAVAAVWLYSNRATLTT